MTTTDFYQSTEADGQRVLRFTIIWSLNEPVDEKDGGPYNPYLYPYPYSYPNLYPYSYQYPYYDHYQYQNQFQTFYPDWSINYEPYSGLGYFNWNKPQSWHWNQYGNQDYLNLYWPQESFPNLQRDCRPYIDFQPYNRLRYLNWNEPPSEYLNWYSNQHFVPEIFNRGRVNGGYHNFGNYDNYIDSFYSTHQNYFPGYQNKAYNPFDRKYYLEGLFNQSETYNWNKYFDQIKGNNAFGYTSSIDSIAPNYQQPTYYNRQYYQKHQSLGDQHSSDLWNNSYSFSNFNAYSPFQLPFIN